MPSYTEFALTDKQQTIVEHKNGVKIIEHILYDGKLVSSKFYHENGLLFNEILLNDGLVQSMKFFDEREKPRYNLS